MLAENKFSKYLFYAVGEILLVVIGILIALNINNNNELKKNEQSITSSLKEIQSNLLDDIKESQNVLETYLERDSIQKKIFDFKNPSTIEDFKNKKVAKLGNFYDDFVINKNGYENLIRQIDFMPKKYEPILKELKKLYVNLNETINVYNERIRSTVYSNLDFVFTQDWETYRIKHKQISNEEANYYINDNRYKNYIIKYMNDADNLLNITMTYRIKAIETYEKIDSILEIKKSNLPLHLLGYVNAHELKEHLGTYEFKREKGGFLKLYLKNNILYFDFSDKDSKNTFTTRNYKLSQNVYSMNGAVWKFNRDTSNKMGIEFITLSWELTKKE